MAKAVPIVADVEMRACWSLVGDEAIMVDIGLRTRLPLVGAEATLAAAAAEGGGGAEPTVLVVLRVRGAVVETMASEYVAVSTATSLLELPTSTSTNSASGEDFTRIPRRPK